MRLNYKNSNLNFLLSSKVKWHYQAKCFHREQ